MPRKRHPSPACQALRPLRNMVVGTALDESSDPVLRAAWDLSRAAGARLFVVYATEMVPMGSELQDEWMTPAMLEAALSSHKTLLGDQLDRLGIDAGELGGWHVEMDAPHHVLLNAARRVSADLLVVGATRSRRLGRLLGSTADRVTRQAPCPVVVVRGDLAVPPRRVLVPVDLSDLSADALVCGLALLERLAPNAAARMKVEALHVVEPDKEPRPQGVTEADLGAAGRRKLEDFLLEHGGDVAPEIEAAVTSGEAREEILRHTRENPVDLVVLSTHGRGGFERLILGSVATEVVREAPVSVLLVPPPAALGTALAEAVTAQTAPLWREETLPQKP
jgi:nucleotide-binding universal stress UspA family protein